MKSLTELGQEMAYPGRLLILGINETHFFHVYGVTARSATSRCRRYVFNEEKNALIVESTDPTLMAQGNLDLLDYTAARYFENGIVISNGRQIDRIASLNQQSSANAVLTENLIEESYEPDNYSTPRITGCTMNNNGVWTQALHIIRNDGLGGSDRMSFDLPLDQPAGYFISTYAGPNIRPTPFFTGTPIKIEALTGDADAITKSVFDAFAGHAEDVRVSFITILISKETGAVSASILNVADLS